MSLKDFAVRGPHAVGVRTVELACEQQPGRTLPTDLWYPAAKRDDADEASQAEHPFNRPHLAAADAPALAGPFPLLVFSHGNSGLRRQSTFLTTHLASWGIAVVAPDHSGNTLHEMARLRSEEARRNVHLAAREQRPGDALAALDAALDGRFDACGFDATRIGALGHSYGGWTATKLPALDARIRALCAMAPASEAFVGRRAYADGELPFGRDLPALILAGVEDVLVDLETSVRPLYERLAAPKTLIGIDAADHFHFCDGIEVLHGLHVRNPRSNARRPTLPYAETVDEARMHRLLAALVTRFFAAQLGDVRPRDGFEASTLRDLDPAVRALAGSH